MKKYKADYSNNYTFLEAMISKENIFCCDSKGHRRSRKELLSEAEVQFFDRDNNTFNGKPLHEGNLSHNADFDWYIVSEVKEEPKKESFVTPEEIDKYNKDDFKYKLAEDYIRSICREEIKNDKMYSLGAKMVQNNEDVEKYAKSIRDKNECTAILKEMKKLYQSFGKPNKTKAGINMSKDVYNMDIFKAMMKKKAWIFMVVD